MGGLTSVFPAQQSANSTVQNTVNSQTPATAEPPVASTNEAIISPTTEMTIESSPMEPFKGGPTQSNISQSPAPQNSTPNIFPIHDTSKSNTPFHGKEDTNSSKFTEMQEKLEKSNLKAVDYENKLQESEKKLSLAEREKIRLEEVQKLCLFLYSVKIACHKHF